MSKQHFVDTFIKNRTSKGVTTRGADHDAKLLAEAERAWQDYKRVHCIQSDE